jgi:leucyl aminopeptidase
MKTILSSSSSSQLETDCLVVIALDRSEPKFAGKLHSENARRANDSENGKNRADKKRSGTDKSTEKATAMASDKSEAFIESADSAVREAAEDVIASGEVTARMFEATLLHRPTGVAAKRLLLLGGGRAKNFSAAELRKLAGAAVRTLKSKNIRNFAIALPGSVVPEFEAVRSIVEGAFVGNFEADYYKSDRKDQNIESITIVAEGAGHSDLKQLEDALQTGRVIGESQNFARDLINEPSNRMTPTILAERAKQMAEDVGLKCDDFGADKIRQLKMGAFWGVAQGSDEPPTLIVLRYEPVGAEPEGDAKDVHIGLVGKGVTFDTGGISIKPADGMEKMKYDMAGAATMIGVMRAIALLKPKVKVTAIVLATENMPSGKAQKPGDVQIAMSGKSIEIINTDAEGRLILADGLTYARQLGCTHLVDAATLTGAVVVALGMVNAGIFASTDDMYERFSAANKIAGEKMWRLPLDDEYKETLKSNIADMVNAGSRYGGAIFAAMFLKEFAEDTPWIHLDIAGTAWMEENKPWIAKGPSGIALRSLIEFVKGWAD